MNTIELTIKNAPLFKGKAWAEQIEFTKSRILTDNDQLLALAFSKDGKQQLYVTNQKVYTNEIVGLASNNEKTISLSSISSIECQSHGLLADIIITASSTNIKISDVQVSIAQEVVKVVNELKVKA